VLYIIGMPYDEKGRPILDGKPVDPDEAQMDSVLKGLSLDPEKVAAGLATRMKKYAADKAGGKS
jgi:hypothetical protein